MPDRLSQAGEIEERRKLISSEGRRRAGVMQETEPGEEGETGGVGMKTHLSSAALTGRITLRSKAPVIVKRALAVSYLGTVQTHLSCASRKVLPRAYALIPLIPTIHYLSLSHLRSHQTSIAT
jgi:hypothetical protein